MEWFENDVQQVEAQTRELTYKPEIIFYGSSSIRLWETLYNDFEAFCPLNMGFGGSTLEACVYFFRRLMKDVNPACIIVYAGDNDLGDGKSAETVLNYFLQLNDLIRHRFGAIPYTYISIKPSISRWSIDSKIRQANMLIKDAIHAMHNNTGFLDIYYSMLDGNGLPNKILYDADGLHLSAAGYQLWKEIVVTHISSQFNVSLM